MLRVSEIINNLPAIMLQFLVQSSDVLVVLCLIMVVRARVLFIVSVVQACSSSSFIVLVKVSMYIRKLFKLLNKKLKGGCSTTVAPEMRLQLSILM